MKTHFVDCLLKLNLSLLLLLKKAGVIILCLLILYCHAENWMLMVWWSFEHTTIDLYEMISVKRSHLNNLKEFLKIVGVSKRSIWQQLAFQQGSNWQNHKRKGRAWSTIGSHGNESSREGETLKGGKISESCSLMFPSHGCSISLQQRQQRQLRQQQ